MSLIQDLSALGNCSTEIAQSLKDKGIKGIRGYCASCPVARYLSSLGYTDVLVGPRRISVNRGSMYFQQALTPVAVQTFISFFDTGTMYRELAEKVHGV